MVLLYVSRPPAFYTLAEGRNPTLGLAYELVDVQFFPDN